MLTDLSLARDARLRARALTHVEALTNRLGPVLTSDVLVEGVPLEDGSKMHLLTRARGIFAPAGDLLVGALSVKTTLPRPGRRQWYDDGEPDDAGLFAYRYQGEDPSSRDNRLVRTCLERGLPLIYFRGVAPSRYEPIICLVVGDEPDALTFHLAPISQADRETSPILRVSALRPLPPDRAYAVREVRQRLHQSRFREMVLDAYDDRCAVCRFRHRPLLDAAHIIGDAEPDGVPTLPNGLSLCKLHHAAFDQQVIGITPDYEIRVAPAVLAAHDGPVYEHALKGVHGRTLFTPDAPAHRPDRERLARRWARVGWR
ncbi:HNH endonuclease [Myxococcota bacterium]|nr:HNH endonuclease [Myxococcota bacterium]